MSGDAEAGKRTGRLLLSAKFTRAVDYARTLGVERLTEAEIPFSSQKLFKTDARRNLRNCPHGHTLLLHSVTSTQ
jgi:hypothetical protein